MIVTFGVERITEVRLEREGGFRSVISFLTQGRSPFQGTAHVTAGINLGQPRPREREFRIELDCASKIILAR